MILKHIEAAGELDNTLIIVTSDNGMPFPRYKGHRFDFSTKVPFVVKWPHNIENPGRNVNSYTSFTDIAPTLLEVADIKKSNMAKREGKSLTNIFNNKVDGTRDKIVTGRERNGPSRPNGWSYPVRSIHTEQYVYSHNFEPNRWPNGTKEAGYMDSDASPTKFYTKHLPKDSMLFKINYGKRPQEELYDIINDPDCLDNLAKKPAFEKIRSDMKDELFAELKLQGDPRMLGNGHVFDDYDGKARAKKYYDWVKKTSSGGWDWKKPKQMLKAKQH